LDADNFLRNAEATVSICFNADARDSRALELINKTNQFNLNGRRMSDVEWESFLRNPEAFLLTASYEDKYGPLGKIAVVMGKMGAPRPHVTAWVMSCRAFSRRIEHQCLKYLFKKLNADEIVFEYQATARNGPLQEFLKELSGETPVPGFSVSRACFEAKASALFHRIVEIENA
jgi:FkbH-like protein